MAFLICMYVLTYLINSSADDITTNVDGVDSYAVVKAAGKYK